MWSSELSLSFHLHWFKFDLMWTWKCSGDPTAASISAKLPSALAKRAGVGAGWNDGSQRVHGRFGSGFSPQNRRNQTARTGQNQTRQPPTQQQTRQIITSNLLCLMRRKLGKERTTFLSSLWCQWCKMDGFMASQFHFALLLSILEFIYVLVRVCFSVCK